MTSLIRWDPFAEFTSLRDAMDRLFEAAVVRPVASFGSTTAGFPMNVYDTGEELRVEAYLPGVSSEDVQVSFEHGALTIAAKRHGIDAGEEAQKGLTWYVREIWPAEFRRTFSLPYAINVDQARATYTHGVLTLTLPKAEEAKPKRIQVQAAPAPKQLEAANTR